MNILTKPSSSKIVAWSFPLLKTKKEVKYVPKHLYKERYVFMFHIAKLILMPESYEIPTFSSLTSTDTLVSLTKFLTNFFLTNLFDELF